jgi:hypothetical protein
LRDCADIGHAGAVRIQSDFNAKAQRRRGRKFLWRVLGYVLLQIPGGYLAGRWSPKKLISLFLVFWGIGAVVRSLGPALPEAGLLKI